MPKRGKISTSRGREQEIRQREARKNLHSDFSNTRASNTVDELSHNLLFCGTCGQRKIETDFNKNKTKEHRFCRDNTCRECCKIRNKKYYAKENNEQRKKRIEAKKRDYLVRHEKRIAAQRRRSRDMILNETTEQRKLRLDKKNASYKTRSKEQNHDK